MNKIKTIPLKKAAFYSGERISCLKLTPDNYIGTDNLLQNKLGKIDAFYTPKTGFTTSYSRGDILVANIRPYLKKIWYASNSGGSSADVLTLKVNESFDSRFIFYSLYRDDFFNYVMKGSKGTKMPRGDKEQILNFLIPDFNFITQQKIATVLSTLDSKIELNNRINSELEAMAKTLYDYWFVQFDFPNKNGKPYKTSGGNMVWSEELKRKIPDGWEVKEMNKLLIKNTAKFDFIDDKHDIDTLDLSVMPSATMCLNEKNISSAFRTNLFKLRKFDILFGGIRPYLLKAGFSPFNGLVTGTVYSFRVKNENDYNFAILTMTHESMFNFAVANSKGTKMPVIGADDLLTYKVAYNVEITKKFNEYIQFREIIAHNIIENQQIAELRDWLLPMLMNGQIKVS